MRIVKNNERKLVDFGELKSGECFVAIASGETFLKIKKHGNLNAVNVRTGDCSYFHADHQIYSVEAHLEVRS